VCESPKEKKFLSKKMPSIGEMGGIVVSAKNALLQFHIKRDTMHDSGHSNGTERVIYANVRQDHTRARRKA
jgi:hypothetical protein